jgi:hypothetical protein
MDDGDSSPPLEFEAAYQVASQRLFIVIERACRSQGEWALGVRAAVRAALRLLANEPALATLLLFGPFEAGEEARRLHQETVLRLTAMLSEGRELLAADPPEVLEEGLIGGFVYVLSRALNAGEAQGLPALAPQLTELLLSPYLGREEAERIAAGE